MNLGAIARHLNLNRRIIRKLALAEIFPVRKERALCASKLDAYKAYLLQCCQKRCCNAVQLLPERRSSGYSGGQTLVRSFVQTLQQPLAGPLPPHDKLFPRQVVAWVLSRIEERTAKQQNILH
jgi:hypothetical protein